MYHGSLCASSGNGETKAVALRGAMAQQKRVSRALQTSTLGIWAMKEVPEGQTGLYLGAQTPPSLAAQPAFVARVNFLT